MSTMVPHLDPPRSGLARAVRMLEIVGVPAAGFATAFAVATSLHGDAKPTASVAPASVQTQASALFERSEAVKLASAPGKVSLSSLPRVPALDTPVRKRRSSSSASATAAAAATVAPASGTTTTTTTNPAPVATAAPVQTAPTQQRATPQRRSSSSTPSYSGKSFDSSGSSSGSGSSSFDSSG